MLYKAMQVKEIPIIFRGKIDGVPSEEPTEPEEAEVLFPERSFTGDSAFPGKEIYMATFFAIDNVISEDEIAVILDGVKYNVPRSGIDDYGSEIAYNYNVLTFDDLENLPETLVDGDIPFAVVCSHAEEGDDEINALMIYLFDGDTHTLKIETPSEPPEPPEPPTENKKLFSAELTGNGQIKRFHARFACGENGTLHINPYVILNGNITVNLCDFAKEGENYISGDNEDFTFECYVPIETHAMLYVEAENVGEYASMLDVAIVVQYEDFIEEETIVGYEGINLRRNHR